MLSFTNNVGNCNKEDLAIVKPNLLCLTYKVATEAFMLVNSAV
jgi:hypothetical protein